MKNLFLLCIFLFSTLTPLAYAESNQNTQKEVTIKKKKRKPQTFIQRMRLKRIMKLRKKRLEEEKKKKSNN